MIKKAIENAVRRSCFFYTGFVCLALLICFIFLWLLYFEQRENNLDYVVRVNKEREIKTLLGFLGRYEAEIEFITKKSKGFPSSDEGYLDDYTASVFAVFMKEAFENAFYSVYERKADGSYEFLYGGGSLLFDKSLTELNEGELHKVSVFEDIRFGNTELSSLVLHGADDGRLIIAVGFQAIQADPASMPSAEYRRMFIESIFFSGVLFLFLVLAVFISAGSYKRSIGFALREIYEGVRQKHMQLREEAFRLKQERNEVDLILDRLAAERKDLEGIIKERITDLREIGLHLRKENEKMSMVNDELRLARKKAVEASMVKTEFLANMSHEVRTPIHGILSYSSFGLKKFEGGKDLRQKTYFDKITVSADRLLMFISDLVDLSDLESGRLIYKITECSLKDILEAALGGLERFAAEKSIAVTLPAEDVRIHCDFVRIKQVFQNIYANAIKFSPEGDLIETEIRLETDFAIVSITDRGMGVDESDKLLIFEKFTQSSRTKTGAGGIGLGLAICREIVLGHGGKIYVTENPEGTGSRFTVELPLGNE